ncbi:unnamed protein product [Owenia fusiformis]|uniref:Uncharacterized protein n=1 Tax=Owenia fusiformis TaxID=6347 RepID=A0A8J1UXL1_OWEFU|nr:unnamed protein product [Owenia fusiformis]
MATHTAGDPLECYSIPLVLQKDPATDPDGNTVFDREGKQQFRCGFKIGGGIDQDPTKSPQGYPDKGVYITYIYDNSPAARAGLQIHDKILQVNGHDYTVVTHKKAIDYIQRKSTLNMLVYRKGVPQMQQKGGQPQGQQSNQQYQQQYSPQAQYSPYQSNQPAQYQRTY